MTFSTNFKHDMPTRVDRREVRRLEREARVRAFRQVVDARDRRTCRCCGKKTNPDDIGLIRGHRHHLVYRSAGGEDAPENILTLCWHCHNDEHKHRLRIDVIDPQVGANGACEFWRKNDDGDWYLSKREIAVGRFEKD